MKWVKSIFVSLTLILLGLLPISSADGANLSQNGFKVDPGKPALRRTISAEVQRIDRGMIFVRTQEGTRRSFSVEEAKKEGIPSVQKGDILTLVIDEGNLVIDVHKQEKIAKNVHSAGNSGQDHRIMDHQVVKGLLDSFDPLDKKVTIRLDSGEKKELDIKVPVLTKLGRIQIGSQVTLEVDEEGRVMDVYRA